MNFDTDDPTNGEQEYATDEKPGENPCQNQYGVSNIVDVKSATYAKDTTKDHAARDKYTTKDHEDGDKPEGSIKVEDVDDEDGGNASDDDANNFMGVDGR